ncbi:uncharacterized protein BDV14DRAFT_180628 [Aspergillus stella-maris]|uniref:uncharacterized protein n=1 Tax=Aspergillus stella-maris TaxID=1810926 RepID=UPI003CCE0F82
MRKKVNCLDGNHGRLKGARLFFVFLFPLYASLLEHLESDMSIRSFTATCSKAKT